MIFLYPALRKNLYSSKYFNFNHFIIMKKWKISIYAYIYIVINYIIIFINIKLAFTKWLAFVPSQ